MNDRQEMVYYELVGLGGAQERLIEPPPGIEIRSAVDLSDLSVIAELYNASFEHLRDEVTEADVAGYAWHPGLTAPGVFLAFEGTLAVGLIVGRLDVPAPGGETRRAAVELLVVRPGYRRRRIATVLMGRLLAWLAATGVETVGTTVGRSGSRHGVATLLERYGFQKKQ